MRRRSTPKRCAASSREIISSSPLPYRARKFSHRSPSDLSLREYVMGSPPCPSPPAPVAAGASPPPGGARGPAPPAAARAGEVSPLAPAAPVAAPFAPPANVCASCARREPIGRDSAMLELRMAASASLETPTSPWAPGWAAFAPLAAFCAAGRPTGLNARGTASALPRSPESDGPPSTRRRMPLPMTAGDVIFELARGAAVPGFALAVSCAAATDGANTGTAGTPGVAVGSSRALDM
mmetsp:Transcript_18272/g.59112  ORF Transcript_18272/g.59112 Transcript_18272/m.59112 type:complete len:238 (+) Transcript_18272:597-1310(+)